MFWLGLSISLVVGIGIVILILMKTREKKGGSAPETLSSVADDHTHSTPTPAPKTNNWKWIGGVFGGIGILLAVVFICWQIFSPAEAPPVGEKEDSTPLSLPLFTEYVTPCEVIEDREFYLESDDPIGEKFLGIDEVVIYSGRGRSQAPAGRWKGPIKFFDPSDPLNGKKSFRIYPKN
jgi:hypothetical protein